MIDDITGREIPFADELPGPVKRKDTDMYLIAAYIAYGARLLRSEVEEVAYGRKLLVVEGDEFILEQAEKDWYAPDGVIRDLPSNILKRYKTALF